MNLFLFVAFAVQDYALQCILQFGAGLIIRYLFCSLKDQFLFMKELSYGACRLGSLVFCIREQVLY